MLTTIVTKHTTTDKIPTANQYITKRGLPGAHYLFVLLFVFLFALCTPRATKKRRGLTGAYVYVCLLCPYVQKEVFQEFAGKHPRTSVYPLAGQVIHICLYLYLYPYIYIYIYILFILFVYLFICLYLYLYVYVYPQIYRYRYR